MGWLGLGVSLPLLRGNPAELECTFLSVGHGCGVVIRAPSGATLLYDAGASMSPERAARSISSYLWSQGIARIDAIVLSHADTDHFNAVPHLLERFSVKAIYVSPWMFDRPAQSLVALREAIQHSRTPLYEIGEGERLVLGSLCQNMSTSRLEECRATILYPPRQVQNAHEARTFSAGNADEGQNVDKERDTRESRSLDNEASIVLAIEFQGRRVLLTGDSQGDGMNAVLGKPLEPCDVLLVPHHGNRRSIVQGLPEKCRPRLAVISGSRKTNAEEAIRVYSARGAEVLHTAEHGAITVRLGEQNVEVRTQFNRFARPDGKAGRTCQ